MTCGMIFFGLIVAIVVVYYSHKGNTEARNYRPEGYRPGLGFKDEDDEE
jgi:hypothetical protein